ncbi:MAG: hypothetical protein ACSLEN_08215 [Candidatus Malihini olakiniferum]
MSALNQDPWAHLELKERLLVNRPESPPRLCSYWLIIYAQYADATSSPYVEIPSGYW